MISDLKGAKEPAKVPRPKSDPAVAACGKNLANASNQFAAASIARLTFPRDSQLFHRQSEIEHLCPCRVAFCCEDRHLISEFTAYVLDPPCCSY